MNILTKLSPARVMAVISAGLLTIGLTACAAQPPRPAVNTPSQNGTANSPVATPPAQSGDDDDDRNDDRDDDKDDNTNNGNQPNGGNDGNDDADDRNEADDRDDQDDDDKDDKDDN